MVKRPPGRLDRGRLDTRADAKQWARASAARRDRRQGIPDQRHDAALSRTAVRGSATQAAPAAIGNQDCLAVNTAHRDSGHGHNQAAPQWHSAVQAAPRRTALLGRLRVERRANGDASSVMTSGQADAGWFGRGQRWNSSWAPD